MALLLLEEHITNSKWRRGRQARQPTHSWITQIHLTAVMHIEEIMTIYIITESTSFRGHQTPNSYRPFCSKKVSDISPVNQQDSWEFSAVNLLPSTPGTWLHDSGYRSYSKGSPCLKTTCTWPSTCSWEETFSSIRNLVCPSSTFAVTTVIVIVAWRSSTRACVLPRIALTWGHTTFIQWTSHCSGMLWCVVE